MMTINLETRKSLSKAKEEQLILQSPFENQKDETAEPVLLVHL